MQEVELQLECLSNKKMECREEEFSCVDRLMHKAYNSARSMRGRNWRRKGFQGFRLYVDIQEALYPIGVAL